MHHRHTTGPRVVPQICQPHPHPAQPPPRGRLRVSQPTQQHGADGGEEILDIVRVCALRAIVDVRVGIGGYLFRGCVELREQDVGARAEVEADGEGVDCAEDEGSRRGEEDAAVVLGDGEQDGRHWCKLRLAEN